MIRNDGTNSFTSRLVGKCIALYGKNGFVQLNANGEIVHLKEYGVTPNTLQAWRNWERFLVVSAGSDDQIALYSICHKMFVSMNLKSTAVVISDVELLPTEWSASERFNVEIIQATQDENNISGCQVSLRNATTGNLFNINGDDVFEIVLHPENNTSTNATSFESINDKIPDHLIREIKAGNVIAFLGAGFSVPAKLPNWVNLIKEIESKIPNLRPSLTAEINYLLEKGTAECLDQAAQMLEDECIENDIANKTGKSFKAIIATILRAPNPLPQQMQNRLDLLKEIPFKAILTTNVDTIVPGSLSNYNPKAASIRREILRKSAKPFYEQIAAAYTHNTTPVLQLHGSIDEPEDMVFTRKGYRDLIHGSGSYLHFIRSVMSRYTILYLGFSFSDYYLNDIRSSVLSMLSTAKLDSVIDEPLAYAITCGMRDEDRKFRLRHEGKL